MEMVLAFVNKVENDTTLQAQVKALSETSGGAEGILALARQHGFAFSREDLDTFMRNTAPTGELPDGQLADVVGGSSASGWWSKITEVIEHYRSLHG